MLKNEFHYRWEWELRSSPEALWPLETELKGFDQARFALWRVIPE